MRVSIEDEPDLKQSKHMMGSTCSICNLVITENVFVNSETHKVMFDQAEAQVRARMDTHMRLHRIQVVMYQVKNQRYSLN